MSNEVATIEPKNIQQNVPAMPAGIAPTNFDQAMRLAEMMASTGLVPDHLAKQPANCLMIIEQSMRWGMSPFAVAQATSVIHGKLMYEGKLVAAAIHASGALKGRLSYEFSGEGNGRTVTVSGLRKGDAEPKTVDVELSKVKTSNKVWETQPDQQLCYSGARIWARRYLPEVMLGVYTPEEDIDEPINEAAQAATVETLNKQIQGNKTDKPADKSAEGPKLTDVIKRIDNAKTPNELKAVRSDAEKLKGDDKDKARAAYNNKKADLAPPKQTDKKPESRPEPAQEQTDEDFSLTGITAQSVKEALEEAENAEDMAAVDAMMNQLSDADQKDLAELYTKKTNDLTNPY